MRGLLGRAACVAGAFTAGAVTAHLASIPHLVRLTANLQRSRARMLAAHEEERRRLRHNLHDELGPTLASVAMSLDEARIMLATDPGRVDPILCEIRDRLATTIGEVRDLAHGLRPPALDDLGLVGAIESLAEGACERVDVRFDGDPSNLPAATEVAAYHIVAEALTNVRRHSNACTALVRLSRDTELHLMVADSGRGLHNGQSPDQTNGARPRPRSGRGLAAMREWAAEVGGGCTITSRAGGGTVVSARLPLAVPGSIGLRPAKADEHERRGHPGPHHR
ncbi:sensor histidine kinase [Actinomadura rudentiformis]|uniref:sensor histidine kinase n=1 Tax=Actinomadura rudentiformis TaxID=359158 RepID=UPI001CEF8753|nr:sensor histidine kinase [Actinomadura rudentiformis]